MALSDVERNVCEAIQQGRDELLGLARTLIGFDTTAREVGDPRRDERAIDVVSPEPAA